MKKDIEAARLVLYGAICGDMIGSAYEWRPTKDIDFDMLPKGSRFTDDSVCTVAVADAIINNRHFDEALQEWCRKFPYAGYGGMFRRWIRSENPQPYNSFGNGSAMRASACGAAAASFDEALDLAKKSAEVTHNHPEGIKGAQAVAAAVWLALQRDDNGARVYSKDGIKAELQALTRYDLGRSYLDFQPEYSFVVTCAGSVPEALICFFESSDYESCVRMAVALGGDSDTQAAIAGPIAAAFYGAIPLHILDSVKKRIELLIPAIEEFNSRVS